MSLNKKLNTFFTLIRDGRVREILQTSTRHIVRISKHRLDILDVDGYVLDRFKSKIPIECKIANDKDMQSLFEQWPDSREEFNRHYEVYYHWGFKKCFLFLNRDTGELVHFSFILTYEDRPKIEKFCLTKKFRFLAFKSCAYNEWLYTFEKYRKHGILTQAMDFIIQFCRKNGIKKLYSNRGFSNLPSIRYADKIGYIPIATIYQIQFLRQQKHAGFYIFKWCHELLR